VISQNAQICGVEGEMKPCRVYNCQHFPRTTIQHDSIAVIAARLDQLNVYKPLNKSPAVVITNACVEIAHCNIHFHFRHLILNP
jgi:hypothetical protein